MQSTVTCLSALSNGAQAYPGFPPLGVFNKTKWTFSESLDLVPYFSLWGLVWEIHTPRRSLSRTRPGRRVQPIFFGCLDLDYSLETAEGTAGYA